MNRMLTLNRVYTYTCAYYHKHRLLACLFP